MPFAQQVLTTQQLKVALQTHGDFLHLTRSHEQSMPAFFFDVVCPQKVAKIKVSVIDTGIICFDPLTQRSNKDIILSSAIHGNETAPIEICNELIRQLILGELPLQHRTLFIFGNPAAINIGQRFVEKNLNRLFSSNHTQANIEHNNLEKSLMNKEQCRALRLEKAVADFYHQGKGERFHYDLHTAIRGSKNDKFAVYPYRHNKPWLKKQLQFMLASGVNTILFSNSPTTTFSYFSSNNFGAHGFTVELGKVKPFGENDMENFVDIRSSLSALISGHQVTTVEYNKDDFSFFEIDQIIERQHEEFSLQFADNVENFTNFPIGTVIAIDGDQEIKICKEGEAIIFPNASVAVGQRALLTVVPVDIHPE